MYKATWQYDDECFMASQVLFDFWLYVHMTVD